MPSIVICGWRGSGKNVFMVNRALKSKRPVYANFKINIPNWNRLTLVKLLDIEENCDLFIDEAYNWLESRTSMKYTNTFSSHVLFQLRKTDRNIYTTVQDFSTIDIRFRKQWDWKVNCERDPGKFFEDNYDWIIKEIIAKPFLKEEDFYDFIYHIEHRKSGSLNSYRYKYELGQKLFSLFNTNEIIEFPNKSRIKYEVLKTEPRLLLKESLRLAKIIKPKLNNITRESTRFALNSINQADIWAKDVYLILKGSIKI